MSKSPTRKIDPELDAAKSGSFKIGCVIDVHRLGFGAMRVTGPGIFGPPEDREEAVRTLKRVPELGINFIDTADSYGPDISEELIRQTLYPYDGLLIATKAGIERPGPGVWQVNGNPQRLREQAIRSCQKLGVEQIGLWQLHRIDQKVPAGEQFGMIRQMIDEGIVRQAGLSEVSIADIEAAQKVFPVATVQNRYNLVDRGSEEVLAFCEAQGIGFIPWYPLAAGDLAKEGSILDGIARKHRATPSQIALAWVLKRSPVMLPIPGTSKVKHLEENVASVNIELNETEFEALDEAGKAAASKAA